MEPLVRTEGDLPGNVCGATGRESRGGASARRRVLFVGVGWIAVIWVIASLLLSGSHKLLQPTTVSTIRFILDHPVAGRSPGERERILEGFARRFSLLSFESQQEVRETAEVRTTFERLTAGEKTRLLRLIIPSSIRNILDAAMRLAPERRAEFVNGLLFAMENDLAMDEGAPANMERIENAVREAVLGYYFDAPMTARFQMRDLLRETFPQVEIP